MPTTQQGSMFIGGSESQPTTQRIEIGVLKDTATVSLSRLLAPNLEITALSRSETIILLAISPDQQMFDTLPPRFCLRIVKRINSKYRGVIEEETELSQFKPGTSPTLDECWAWNLLIKHFAAVRFFEIWGKGKISDVYRGLAGKTHNFQSSISGMIGGKLYNDGRAVDKDANGRFFPCFWEEIYPNIPRWPTKGIDSAKALAHLIHDKITDEASSPTRDEAKLR